MDIGCSSGVEGLETAWANLHLEGHGRNFPRAVLACKRRTRIKKPDSEWLSVEIPYEKLTTFRFICGCLGHTDRGSVVRFMEFWINMHYLKFFFN